MNYNEINANPRDCRLTFDEAEHRYTLGDRELKSVTTLVQEAFPVFDADYWSARKGAELGIDPKILLNRWQENSRRARMLGTRMHARIEDYYLGRNPIDDDSDAFGNFRRFAGMYRLNPYRTEWRIFHEDYGVAGTLDFLDFTDGCFTIWDWKRSCKLIDRNGRSIQPQRGTGKCLHPALSHLHDLSYFHYALQLSIYRLILEDKYGIQASDQRLGIFHPDYPRFYVMTVPYLRNEAITLLRDHSLSYKQSNHNSNPHGL